MHRGSRMSRTERLFDIMQTLRRHRRPVSGQALAQACGISLRTLYRDIATLQALGAEIDGEAGIGYVLKPGFLLPPLMFSAQEIEALALGLKWAQKRTDSALGDAAGAAMAKVAAVLPAELRELFDDDALQIAPACALPQQVELALLRQALNSERRLQLDYADQEGRRTQRVIWPVTLGFFEHTRMLVGWCELRNDFRHFRVDRILRAELLAEPTPKRRRELMRAWRLMMNTQAETADRN